MLLIKLTNLTTGLTMTLSEASQMRFQLCFRRFPGALAFLLNTGTHHWSKAVLFDQKTIFCKVVVLYGVCKAIPIFKQDDSCCFLTH